MTTNPFESEDEMYVVLINAAGQRSLWPAFLRVPSGWTVEREPIARADAIHGLRESSEPGPS